MKKDDFDAVAPGDILYIIPKYEDDIGNVTVIKTLDDTIIIHYQLRTVMKKLFSKFDYNEERYKAKISQITGKRKLNIFPFESNLLLMQVKTRNSVGKDPVYGYINLKNVENISWEGQYSKIRFSNDHELISLQKHRSIAANQTIANFVDLKFVKQKSEVYAVDVLDCLVEIYPEFFNKPRYH